MTRSAYDDLDSTTTMRADAIAAASHLQWPVAPSASIRFEDYPQDRAKPQLSVSDAAARLASALHLHLD